MLGFSNLANTSRGKLELSELTSRYDISKFFFSDEFALSSFFNPLGVFAGVATLNSFNTGDRFLCDLPKMVQISEVFFISGVCDVLYLKQKTWGGAAIRIERFAKLYYVHLKSSFYLL